MQEKLFYKISEVSKQTGIEAYVLRFWETEFPSLKPRKSKGNQRTYTKKEIDLILKIKKMLYQEGLTISGARKKLKHASREASANDPSQALSHVKKELEALLHLLN